MLWDIQKKLVDMAWAAVELNALTKSGAFPERRQLEFDRLLRAVQETLYLRAIAGSLVEDTQLATNLDDALRGACVDLPRDCELTDDQYSALHSRVDGAIMKTLMLTRRILFPTA